MENLNVKFLRGISGSGKSTYRNTLTENGWVCVSRDDLRFMMSGENYDYKKKSENLITYMEYQLIEQYTYLGKNIIIDATNLNPSFLNGYFSCFARLMQKNNSKFTFSYYEIDLPLEEAIARNNKREGIRRVPEDIIKKQHETFLNKGDSWREKFQLYANNPYLALNIVEQNLKLPNAIIFDIDGTLALKGDRSSYDGEKVNLDKINRPVKQLYDLLEPVYVIICTGREDVGGCKNKTEKWLLDNEIYYDEFYIRKENDHRSDWVVKREFLEDIVKKYNVIFAIDDRYQVVENCWRQSGIPCFQVESNNF